MSNIVLEYLKQRSGMSEREKNVLLDMMVLHSNPLDPDRSAMPGVDAAIAFEISDVKTHCSLPEIQKKKTKKRGRAIKFDEDVTTADPSIRKIKEWVMTKSFQKKLNENEIGLYLALIKGVKIDEMDISHRDKVVALYKRIGRRLNG